jgi:transcriptional regulator, AraC family
LKHIPTHNTDSDIIVKRIEDCHEFNFDGMHRHAFYELLLFTEVPEDALHSIDFEENPVRTDCLYILNPGQVYSIALTSHKGFLITIRPEYLQSSGLLFENRLGSMAPSILNFGDKDMKNIRVFAEVLYEEYTGLQRPQIITAHINTLLSYLSLFIRDYHAENGISNRMRSLLELIEQHYISEHNVAFYAAKLSLGNKRLNVLSVESFGQTAKQLLASRLLLQAKRLISTSHSTFKEIASGLGFKDASYFSRFFRQQSGMTPEKFRRSLSQKP